MKWKALYSLRSFRRGFCFSLGSIPCRSVHSRLIQGGVGSSLSESLAFITPSLSMRRVISTTAAVEKKFHCGVCKKAFRLSTAAKLHVQQAHNGEGSVESGPGPGVQSSSTPIVSSSPAAPVGDLSSVSFRSLTATPSSSSSFVSSSSMSSHNRDNGGATESYAKPGRPIPRPLHAPDQMIPDDIMKALLEVWDTIGASRLNDTFLPSAAAVKVLAAPGADNASGDSTESMDMPPLPIPSGINIFQEITSASLEALTSLSIVSFPVNPSSYFKIDPLDLFAQCPALVGDDIYSENHGWPVAIPNPLTRIPFFQISETPKTGKIEKDTLQSTTSTSNLSASEITNATGALPFFEMPDTPPVLCNSQSQSSSTATYVSQVGQIASPFQQALLNSPFSGPVVANANTPSSSPVSPTNIKPTTTTSGILSAEVATERPCSPFVSNSAVLDGEKASSKLLLQKVGNESNEVSITNKSSSADSQEFPVSNESSKTSLATKNICTRCGKGFNTFFALSTHSKDKHDVVLSNLYEKEKNTSVRDIPEMPPYIPTPVDLSATIPFGGERHEIICSKWTLYPHTQAISNMTITGKILNIEKGVTHRNELVTEVTVFLSSQIPNEEETVYIHCLGHWATYSNENLSIEDTIFCSGVLRLYTFYDSETRRRFLTPILRVSPPLGSLHLMESSQSVNST